MLRNLMILTLLFSLALFGCSKKTETHEPAGTAPMDSGQEQPVDDADTTDTDPMTSDSMGSDEATPTDDPNSEGALICTQEWFEWVNTQVMASNSEDIAEQYPSGLPDIGSDEWFTAVDTLTGGDGAHGPDGGSDEWCVMVQQRLRTPD